MTLISQPQLTQRSYTVRCLPETGAVLSITDAEGRSRTEGAGILLTAPEGYGLYGDLPALFCDGVEGYAALTME